MIVINVGISGSGKTTWTRDFCVENPTFLRINRDDIRRVLVGKLEGYFERKDVYRIEDIINDIEVEMFYDISKGKYDLIIDNTNLSINYIRKWIELGEEAKTIIKIKLFDCPPGEAITRVFFRDKVDTAYISGQYERYKSLKIILEQDYKKYIYAGEA